MLLIFLYFSMQSDRSRNRFVILLGCALLSVFGSNMAQFSGAGALGVLVMATVASYGWGDSEKVGQSVMKSMPASIALEYHDMFLLQSSLLLCPFYQLMQIF